MRIRQEGQFYQADFFENTGGLNNSDSPFAVQPNEATNGWNFDYIRKGGIQKRFGHVKVNTTADTQTSALGIGLYENTSGSKYVMRAAGVKWQTVDLTAKTFTNLTEDTTTATETVFSSGTTERVVFNQFNNSSASVLWAAGGGLTYPYGAYSSTKFTKNGVPEPTGSISASQAAGTSAFVSTGTFYYAVAFRKASTQAISNATLDTSIAVSNTTNAVTITLSNITAVDTTKYDKIYVYRSAVGGVSEFTTGDLVGQVDSTVASFVDTGSSIIASDPVPRGGSTVLDNTALPTGTYKAITTFKRRLVTANNSTLYISDTNKAESWPTENVITVPSGGPITALAVISFSSPTSTSLDELLCIFKERELWVVTGTDSDDFALKFIDTVGTTSQSLVVPATGFISWVGPRGIYLWYGTGKPVYASPTIQSFFESDGDIDLTRLARGYGALYKKTNQIVWVLSDKIFGINSRYLKMDTRLTYPRIDSSIGQSVISGVFTPDTGYRMECFSSMIPPGEYEEYLIGSDNSGFVYRMYNGHADGSSAIEFRYDTANLDLGTPGRRKRVSKVIVWVNEIGDWDLTLNMWSSYGIGDARKFTRAVRMSNNADNAAALWDVAYWDIAFWDEGDTRTVPLVYNIDNIKGNGEGDSFRLQFMQEGANQPVIIYGFSIIYSDIGSTK